MVNKKLSPDNTDTMLLVNIHKRHTYILNSLLRSKLAMCSLVFLVFIFLLSLTSPLWWPYKYDIFTNDISVPPSIKHIVGTDSNGYDIFARVMYGTQMTIRISILTGIITSTFGILYGLISGFFGGIVDNIMMRLADFSLVMPILVLASILANLINVGGGMWIYIVLLLSALSWPSIARVIRSNVLTLKNIEFIVAIRVLGAKKFYIIIKHLLPNLLNVIIVNVTLLISAVVLTETALSFLGFGIREPQVSLGLLVNQGQASAFTRPWLFYTPAFMVTLITLAINYIGSVLQDIVDPKKSNIH